MTTTISRSESVGTRLSPIERSALERIATMEHLTISEAQRLLIREEAKRRGVWPSTTAGDVVAVEAEAVL